MVFVDVQDWIGACHLPLCVPGFNVVGSVWSVLRPTGQANTGFTGPDHLVRRRRHGLRRIRYRGDIIDGCLTGTGLTLPAPRLQAQW
ncbi:MULTISPECIES: hypothetical protein [Streptomyces]|uniref:hypothetical protein n=1 Tax=Streptomyces TaxID=1883 RepID=UPI00117DBCED|nr:MULTISPECIES: hypothetical protein [Streptomyces]MBK3589033.1 hypothetical protein [Streptomyces sp. MBT57]WSR89348.1 hypothetical protein OG728_02575 [Streptomyces microflavus]WTF67280.1 hypothetical protein OH770_00965 [Streptomyces microflavus]